jgi:hypothetical protein
MGRGRDHSWPIRILEKAVRLERDLFTTSYNERKLAN